MRMRWRHSLAAICASLVLGLPVGAEGDPSFEAYERSEEAFARGLVASETGRDREARGAYQEAIELDGGFVEAMVNLARLELGLGRLEQAQVWLERAARVRTDYPELHKVRGLAALKEGRPQDAVVFLNRARKRVPEDAEVLVNLGAAMLRLGVLGEAKGILEKAVKLEPACAPCAINLAVIADQQGKVPRALFFYRRFLDLVGIRDPDHDKILRRIDLLSGTKVESQVKKGTNESENVQGSPTRGE